MRQTTARLNPYAKHGLAARRTCAASRSRLVARLGRETATPRGSSPRYDPPGILQLTHSGLAPEVCLAYQYPVYPFHCTLFVRESREKHQESGGKKHRSPHEAAVGQCPARDQQAQHHPAVPRLSHHALSHDRLIGGRRPSLSSLLRCEQPPAESHWRSSG
jgi:hypothetical protein